MGTGQETITYSIVIARITREHPSAVLTRINIIRGQVQDHLYGLKRR